MLVCTVQALHSNQDKAVFNHGTAPCAHADALLLHVVICAAAWHYVAACRG
jgi:hypothetical protein